MLQRIRTKMNSLTIQMILGFVLLALITAGAGGIPAILLINERLEIQAWAQVEQGSRASRALFTARENNIRTLATLTAQRPTLQEYLLAGDREALPGYLHRLQDAAGLDTIILCDAQGAIISAVGENVPGNPCQEEISDGYYILERDGNPFVILLARSELVVDGQRLGEVNVGLLLDDAFTREMRDQTNLEHTLFVDGVAISSSLPWTQDLRRIPAKSSQATNTLSFTQGGELYYAGRIFLDDSRVESEVALPIGGITATRRQLAWRLAGSILLIALTASLLGGYLARRIGKSFRLLAAAAHSFSMGDLESPVEVDTKVQEAELVARALEHTRMELRQTMGQLREEKAWGDHLLEAIIEGIVTLDAQNRITFFSPGAERILGWRSEEVLSRPCNEIFKPAESPLPFDQLIPPPGQRRRVLIKTRADDFATLAISRALLAPSEVPSAEVVFVFRDISEEDAIHRVLGHFMANISHEFRTPLSALAASIELLLEEASDFDAEELAELLNSLHLGILSLQTLVDNLIESASIETGHFRVSPKRSDLADEIISEAIRIMQPLLEKHDQSLSLYLPLDLPFVVADARRTTQVIVNLLSNANKFSPPGTKISISVERQEGFVKIEVSDEGPGIPIDLHDRVFRRFFYQADPAQNVQYGAGLGLSVVKAIIEAQGGMVGVEGHPQGGATFWFTLPIAEDA